MKVFALCRTYFQVAQTLALCEFFKKQDRNLELKIFRGKTGLNNFAIKNDVLDFSIQDYPISMIDMPRSIPITIPLAIKDLIISSLKKNVPKKNIMVAPGAPNLYFLSILKDSRSNIDAFFSIEEGIGTYGTILSRTKSKMYKKGKELYYFVFYFFIELVKQLLLRIVTYRSGGIIETISNRIESHSRNQITLAPLLKRTLSSNVFNSSKMIIHKNTILFISTPFVENNILDKKSYLSIINVTCNYFLDQGKNFLIKPHPDEKVDKFNKHMICDFDGPVEALLSAHIDKIVGVVGINSTALILAKKLFNLPTYKIDHKFIFYDNKRHLNTNSQRLYTEYTEVLKSLCDVINENRQKKL